MMKNLILFLCAFLFSTPVFSQFPLLEEDFNYPTGDTLGSHGWIHFSPNSITSPVLTVTSPGLVYAGYPNSGIGNSTTLTLTGNQDSYKPLENSVSSGSAYASFMVNVDTAKAAGDFFVCFLPGSSLTNFQARCYVKKATISNNISFGISKTTAGAGGVFYSDSVYSMGTTYLIVVKYKFNIASNTDDEVSLFVFNSGIIPVEPLPTVGPVTGTASDIPNISRFVLRQSTSSSTTPLLKIDGIKIALDWENALPVDLSALSFSIDNANVNLNWSTVSEMNNNGFYIQRINTSGKFTNQWIDIGFVRGNGTTTTLHNYTFTDRNLIPGKYNYRLKQVDYNGNSEYFNLNHDVSIVVPEKYILSQNYPNPFNPVTIINYEIPLEGKVTIKVFDLRGKEVSTLVDDFKTAGYYFVNFNASNLASGVYSYTIASGNFVETKRMLLCK